MPEALAVVAAGAVLVVFVLVVYHLDSRRPEDESKRMEEEASLYSDLQKPWNTSQQSSHFSTPTDLTFSMNSDSSQTASDDLEDDDAPSAEGVESEPYPRIPGGHQIPPDWLLNETDPPFDLKSYFVQIPTQQNAAPLYLEALANYGPELAICFPKGQRAAIRALANARMPELNMVMDVATTQMRAVIQSEDIERLIGPFERIFEIVVRGQSRPRCTFAVLGLTASDAMPYGPAVRRLVLVALLRCARDYAAGEFARPLATLGVVVRLARDLQFRSLMISQLIAVALLQRVRRSAEDLLATPGVEPGHVDQLIEMLKEHERESTPSPLAEGLRMEYPLVRLSLHHLEHRTGEFSHQGLEKQSRVFGRRFKTVGAFLEHLTGFGREMGRLPTARRSKAEYDTRLAQMKSEDYRREERAFARFWRAAISEAELPFPRQDPELNELLEIQSGSLLLPALLACHPTLGMSLARGQVHTRVALCLAVIKRWELEHGTMPPNLEVAARAAGLDEVPIDTFTDRPLHMKVVNNVALVRPADPTGIA